MFGDNSVGRSLDILHRNMDVSLLRQDVIANNIANADTPNFKRSEVNFESELQDALASERKTTEFTAARTHEDHINFHREIDYQSVRPRVRLDYATTADNNGNNVDIEQETMNYLQNQMNYTLMTQSMSAQFNRVNLVLR